MPLDPDHLLALARTHTVVADLTITDGQLAGTIRVRPRRQRKTTATGRSEPSPPAEPAESKNPNAILSNLLAIGIDTDTAARIAATYDPERILQVCTVARNKRSPSGFALRALANGWKFKQE